MFSLRVHKSHSYDSMQDGYRRGPSVIRCPTPPAVVKRVVERVPTPEPEIIENVQLL